MFLFCYCTCSYSVKKVYRMLCCDLTVPFKNKTKKYIKKGSNVVANEERNAAFKKMKSIVRI